MKVSSLRRMWIIYGLELPSLRWMRNRSQPPPYRDETVLDGGAKLGNFWSDCKRRKRCAKYPYDRLLTNPVLRADSRYNQVTQH